MDPDPHDPTALPPPLRSPGELRPALLWALDHATRQRSRHLTWVDPDFAAWPLDDPELLDRLAGWIRLPQRRLTLIARDWSLVQRRYPRFVAWRRPWTHAVEAWSPSDDTPVALPTLLFDDARLSLQVFDAVSGRGRVQLDDAVVQRWRDEIDALLQRCESSFPAHPLGL